MTTLKSRRLSRIQVTALTLLVLSGFVNYLDRSTLAIANHSMAHELSFSPTQMGLLLSVFSWAYAVAQLPVGGLLDRFGARLTLGIGMCIWSAAQAALGAFSSMTHLLTARVFLGLGEAPQFPAGAKVVSEWFHVKERGLPSGIFNMASSMGPAIAQPILTGLLLAIGWRSTFVAMGALGGAVAVIWYLVYRDRRTSRLSHEETAYLEEGMRVGESAQRLSFTDWKSLFRMRITWGLTFGYVGIIYMLSLFLSWLPAYFEQSHGISLAHAGWISSIPFLSGTVGVLSGGAIVDRLARRRHNAWNARKWPICGGMIVSAIATVATAYATSLISAIACLCVAMCALNVGVAGAWSLVSIAVPSRMVASLGSLQNFGGYFGGAFAPVITGMIVQRTGSFALALTISAAVAFAGAAFYFFLTPKPAFDKTDAALAQAR